MSQWTKEVAFPKIVRKLKQNNYVIAKAEYPEIVMFDRCSGIPVILDYSEDRDFWGIDLNSFFYPNVKGLGCIMSALDDGKYLLNGSSFPSKVVNALEREAKFMRNERKWFLRWTWAYDRNNPEVNDEE